MGIFDLFRGTKKDDPKGKANQVAKWGPIAADKRAQNYDRLEALEAMVDIGTADAAAALLRRFTFVIDPSITDQEEKELAFRGILSAGKEAIAPVRAFAQKAESLAWPMRVLKELLSQEEFVEELLEWLSRWDTEYAKFVDPKLQLLAALEEYRDPKIAEAVEPFLEDASEPARFHAVATLLAQEGEDRKTSLLSALKGEESVRVRNKIAEGFVVNGWVVEEDERDAVRRVLTDDYALAPTGTIQRMRG